MLSNTLLPLMALALPSLTMAAEVHAQGAKGTTMGPVAFLWPNDRPWAADHDNVGPCGSSAGVSNRTAFPTSLGSVALSIADEAYEVAFRIAYGNNPTSQSEFQTFTAGNVTEIEPGHQCYPIPSAAVAATAAGQNATIQMEYWASDSNPKKNESFFACADITFVDVQAFTARIPCFNVTSSEFNAPGSSAAPAAATPSSATAPNTAAAPAVPEASNNGGLSTGAKAGIAVGAVVGSLFILGAAILAFRRNRAAKAKDAEAGELNFGVKKQMVETASMVSGETAVRR